MYKGLFVEPFFVSEEAMKKLFEQDKDLTSTFIDERLLL